jgi:hypothetical protein
MSAMQENWATNWLGIDFGTKNNFVTNFGSWQNFHIQLFHFPLIFV